jgi:FkbM family methyltransferase
MFTFLLSMKKPQTIVQVGAWLGDDSLISACRRFGHRLYMFEPNPARVKELEAKAAGAATIHVIPMAVSSYNGKATFNIAAHDDCSSLQNFDAGANANWVHEWHPYKNFEMVDRFEVDVIRLDTFFGRNGIEGIDLLEIDAQGEDLRVVEGLGERIRDVKKIQIEVNISGKPLYDNSFTRDEAVSFFTSHGFEQHISWKQCLNREENVVFRNKLHYPNALINAVSAGMEQRSRAAYFAAVKLPRVLAVTGMMMRQKFSRQHQESI